MWNFMKGKLCSGFPEICFMRKGLQFRKVFAPAYRHRLTAVHAKPVSARFAGGVPAQKIKKMKKIEKRC